MKKIAVILGGVALAMFAGDLAMAQNAPMAPEGAQSVKRKIQNSRGYDRKGSAKYRPLTVSKVQQNGIAAGTVAGPGEGLGNALASPFNAIGAAGGPIGAVGSGVGGVVSGATGLAFSPLGALGGQAPGISSIAAPPLPIKARYAGTGKVFSSYDEGYSQDVPVDASGPIYKIDDKAIRTVTPFTLAAFPISGLAYGITSPLRPRVAQP